MESKYIAFRNRLREAIQAAYHSLKKRYKYVLYEVKHTFGPFSDGFFIVHN